MTDNFGLFPRVSFQFLLTDMKTLNLNTSLKYQADL
jgi:hypothetical protein